MYRRHKDGFCLSGSGKAVSFPPLLMLTWIVTSVLNSFLAADCCRRFTTSGRVAVTLSVRLLSSINKETTLVRLLSDSTIPSLAHMQSFFFSWFINNCCYFGPKKRRKKSKYNIFDLCLYRRTNMSIRKYTSFVPRLNFVWEFWGCCRKEKIILKLLRLVVHRFA